MTITVTEAPASAVPHNVQDPDPVGRILDGLAAYVQAHPEMEPALLAALLGRDGMPPSLVADAVCYPGGSEVEDRVKAAKVEMSWLLAAAKSATKDGDR